MDTKIINNVPVTGDNKPKKIKGVNENKTMFAITSCIIIAIYAVTLILPLVWAIIVSFKSRIDFHNNPFGLPTKWLFSNYSDAFRQLFVIVRSAEGGTRNVYLLEMFYNSVFYTVSTTLISEITRASTAYCACKFRHYKAMRWFYAFIIFMMVFPLSGSAASTMIILRSIGAYDNMYVRVLMAGGFGGTNWLIFYASFKSLSWGYAEAAQMDGASQFNIFFSIMLPLVKTTFFAMFLLSFIAGWNDYTTSLMWMPSYPTVAYGLFTFQFSNSNAVSSVPMQLAGCSLVIIPVLIIFFCFRDKFIGNLTMGGFKG